MVNLKKWMLFLSLLPLTAGAQPADRLDLATAYDLAVKNYPLIKQKDLITQTADLTISNLSKGYLPQFSVNGQATYQSDVTKVNVPLPGFSIPSASKDQYRVTADLNQVIFDGGAIKEQKTLQELNAGVEQDKVEVELYKLKERINQFYLGILYLDEQLKQVGLVQEDIRIGMDRVQAQVNNGVAFKSNLTVLKAEFLKSQQHAIELKSSRKGLIQTLAIFLHRPLREQLQLERPTDPTVSIDSNIARPELKLYASQEKLVSHQDKLIQVKNLPKASLFAQGGYGRPGLNQLDNQFDFFYIGGVRLNWSLGGLYTRKKEKQLVKINQRSVDIQKESFLLNTNSQLQQEQSDIEKLDELAASDLEIIELRESVKMAAKAQLENGVITANDYLREVNAEDQARQALITHKLQLLQAKINYQTISGKQ